jgi:hypothetical protein
VDINVFIMQIDYVMKQLANGKRMEKDCFLRTLNFFLKKKTASSPTKVNARGKVGEGRGSEVRGCPKRDSLVAVQSLKMVIFNVHSTLLDCSVKVERNPNSCTRSSVQTRSRRVVFRPGLIPFLSRCFMKFIVAF